MNTLSFIGSDKNAGKTTVLNFVYGKIMKDFGSNVPVCITSIGINGEEVDFFEGLPKPSILLHKDSYFVTAQEQLRNHDAQYDVLHNFLTPDFSKNYTLCKCRSDFNIILEGPNCKREILDMKKKIKSLLPECILLIDGSVDRQFLAHPDISNAFYFAVLISSRKEQLRKAEDLLLPLSFPLCSGMLRQMINKADSGHLRSIFFNEKNQVVFKGKRIPFLDNELKEVCVKHKKRTGYLYLKGALSRSLFEFLSPFKNLSVILESFSLYHNISTHENSADLFLPNLYLLYPVKVLSFFLKMDNGLGEKRDAVIDSMPFPEGIPVHDLFNENPDEIEILTGVHS